jgi:hypothetical protein
MQLFVGNLAFTITVQALRACFEAYGTVDAVRITSGYCWRIYFKVLEVLLLAHVSRAFWPSKKACGTHKFRHF